jgi:hypothetical protein
MDRGQASKPATELVCKISKIHAALIRVPLHTTKSKQTKCVVSPGLLRHFR